MIKHVFIYHLSSGKRKLLSFNMALIINEQTLSVGMATYNICNSVSPPLFFHYFSDVAFILQKVWSRRATCTRYGWWWWSRVTKTSQKHWSKLLGRKVEIQNTFKVKLIFLLWISNRFPLHTLQFLNCFNFSTDTTNMESSLPGWKSIVCWTIVLCVMEPYSIWWNGETYPMTKLLGKMRMKKLLAWRLPLSSIMIWEQHVMLMLVSVLKCVYIFWENGKVCNYYNLSIIWSSTLWWWFLSFFLPFSWNNSPILFLVGKSKKGKKKGKARARELGEEDREPSSPRRYTPPPDKPVTNLSKKWEKQPDYLDMTGLSLHEYQLEGVNWLRWVLIAMMKLSCLHILIIQSALKHFVCLIV